MPSPFDFNAVLSHVGNIFADALSKKWQQEQEQQAFQQFQQGITEAHAQPIQRGLVPAQPGSGGPGQPTRLPVPAQPIMGVDVTQQQIPMSDPRFLNAAMNYLQTSPGAAGTLQSYLKLREMGQPTYTQKEIPAGGEIVNYRQTPGGAPTPFRTDIGQPKTALHTPFDKKVSSRVGPDNMMYDMMQTPTNDFYEMQSGPVLQKPPVSKTAAQGPVKLVVDGKTGLSKYKYMSEIVPEDRPLTAQAQNTGEMAGSVASHIPGVIQEINDLDAKGKLGPLAGRWSAFTTSGIGKGDDPEYATLYSDISLIKSGLSKVHFGARGGQQALERFDKMLSAEKMDKETMLGALKSISPWLEGYAKMGGAATGTSTPNPSILSGEDKQAADWAKANPNDPRSAKILQHLGIK